jgi:hypothetical protein
MVQLRGARRSPVLESAAEIAQLPLEPLDHRGLSLDDLDQLLVLRPYTVKRATQPARRTNRGARLALCDAGPVIRDESHAAEVAPGRLLLTGPHRASPAAPWHRLRLVAAHDNKPNAKARVMCRTVEFFYRRAQSAQGRLNFVSLQGFAASRECFLSSPLIRHDPYHPRSIPPLRRSRR